MSRSDNTLNRNASHPHEKDFAPRDWSPDTRVNNHLDDSMDADTALRRIQTSGSISISPELFEKIYLSPQNNVKGELRKTFGNPTPLAIVGFLMCLTPLSCDLMNWRGASPGNGATDIGAYVGFGGILMILGGIGEWIIGNTFPFVVFASFGAFYITFAALLWPYSGAVANYAAYSADPTNPASGQNTVPFNAAFGFFTLWMGVLCFVYLICALRTNIVFVLIFLTLVIAFGILTGTYWHLAQGNTAYAARLEVIAGAFYFCTAIFGWWIFFALMLASVDFPFNIPVGDLSRFVKGAGDKRKVNKDEEAMET